MMQAPETFATIREYYGETLTGTIDLKTNACCTTDALPDYVKDVLSLIDDEVLTRFYGCGSPLPPALTGSTVLDLGCGTGRDAFVASKLVGESGHVIGIDMTSKQLEIANRHIANHARKFEYLKPNVEFHHGFIEDLRMVGIEDDSIDVVISNCVINLSPDKRKVFSEIFRVLKPGGELYFSDVFADRRIPPSIKNDRVLYGECLGGAMYYEDFRRELVDLGVRDVRVVSSGDISIDDRVLKRKVGNIRFTSKTIRAFKLGESLEDRCENYGQVAYYLGTMDEYPHEFILDDHHLFQTGLPVPVCGNTAAMLAETRYASHFNVIGTRDVHYGLFDCAPSGASIAPSDCGC